MTKRLYPKLALTNIKKNGRFYYPYLITIFGACACFYIMCALANDPGVSIMRGSQYVMSMMVMGIMVGGLFIFIFLCYTNSFLMKRRKKELGLYTVLGLNRRNLAAVMCYEMLFTGLIGIGGGLLCGILFYKLALLLLYRILQFPIPFGFSISIKAVLITIAYFVVVLFLILLGNLKTLRFSKPIALLYGTNTGEREPKTRYILTVLGVLMLGVGYGIALKVNSASEALAGYFLAVALVIVGTYLLFTTISISILKLMRSRKQYYYQTRHFINVSGMLFRMKQNAVGLANICILSTMVLVMISGTLSMYLGTEESVKQLYPGDLNVYVRYKRAYQYEKIAGNVIEQDEIVKLAEGYALDSVDTAAMEEKLRACVAEEGRTITRMDTLHYLYFSDQMEMQDGTTRVLLNSRRADDVPVISFLTADDYAKLTTTAPPVLKADEVMVCELDTEVGDRFVLADAAGQLTPLTFQVKEHRQERLSYGQLAERWTRDNQGVCFVIVANDAVLEAVYNLQAEVYQIRSAAYYWEAQIDVDGTTEEQLALYDKMRGYRNQDGETGTWVNYDWSGTGEWEMLIVRSQADYAEDTFAMAGGFLFLGILLGFLFILAAVLIIYYKQISEGYEDQSRFEIMRKVGLTTKEIKRAINSQVLTVFFLPILIAGVHVVFDFRIMLLLLRMFHLENVGLTAICTAATMVCFLVIYSIVYKLTARVYYGIVSDKEHG